MTQGGYLETAGSRPRPIGLGIVIAAHVAVLAAVMLAKGEIIRLREIPTVDQEYRADHKPPPPAPHPKVKPDDKAPTTIDKPVFVDVKPLDPGKTIDPPSFPTDTGATETGAGSGGRIVSAAPVFVDARVDPRFTGDFQPRYPSSAQRDGISGKATVRVRIGVDGRVKLVELVRADDPAFFEATEYQALRRWRFTPATRDGVAIESVKELTVSFVLRD